MEAEVRDREAVAGLHKKRFLFSTSTILGNDSSRQNWIYQIIIIDDLIVTIVSAPSKNPGLLANINTAFGQQDLAANLWWTFKYPEPVPSLNT